MTSTEREYVSIVEWPAGCGDALRMGAFTEVLGADAFQAKEWMRRTLPSVFSRETSARAAEVVADLRSRGIIAVCVPMLAIKARLEPPLLRQLTRVKAGSAYEFGLGRAGLSTLEAKHIVLVVRGHLRNVPGHDEGELGVQALHQLQGTLSAEDWDQGHTARRRLRLVEVVDIHSAAGGQWRIIGGRCAIAGVPDGEPATTRAGLDHLVAQITRDNPRVIVDNRFEHATFTAEIAPDFGVTGDWRSLGGFSVYSAWLRELETAGVLK
jgi:hypothetical protein